MRPEGTILELFWATPTAADLPNIGYPSPLNQKLPGTPDHAMSRRVLYGLMTGITKWCRHSKQLAVRAEVDPKSFHEKAGMSQVGFVFLVLSNPWVSNRSASAAILPSALFL